jgi:uncharacterized membrane protein
MISFSFCSLAKKSASVFLSVVLLSGILPQRSYAQEESPDNDIIIDNELNNSEEETYSPLIGTGGDSARMVLAEQQGEIGAFDVDGFTILQEEQYVQMGDTLYGPISTEEDISDMVYEIDDKTEEEKTLEMQEAITLSGDELNTFINEGGTVGEEIIAFRDEYTKVEKRIDGDYYAESYFSPVHFQTNTGEYLHINNEIHDLNIPVAIPEDNTLIEATSFEASLLPSNIPVSADKYDYGVLASNTKYLWKDNVEGYPYVITEVSDNSYLHWVPVGIRNNENSSEINFSEIDGIYDDNTLTFSNIAPNIDNHYIVDGNTLYRTFLLNQIPDVTETGTNISLRFLLQVPEGSEFLVNDEVQADTFSTSEPVTLSSNSDIVTLSAPMLQDAIGYSADSEDISYTLTKQTASESSTDDWLVDIVISSDWLLDSNITYPVSLSFNSAYQLPSITGSEFSADANNGTDPNRQSHCEYTAVVADTISGPAYGTESKNTFGNAYLSNKLSFKTGMWNGDGYPEYKKGIIGWSPSKLPKFKNATNIRDGNLVLYHNGAIGFPSSGHTIGIKKITDSFSCNSKWNTLAVSGSWSGTKPIKTSRPIETDGLLYYNISSDLQNWASSGSGLSGYAVDNTNLSSWDSGQSFIMLADKDGTQKYPHIRVIYTPGDDSGGGGGNPPPSSSLPDIIHKSVKISPTNYKPGDTVQLSLSLTNIGGSNAGSSEVHYYIKKDDGSNVIEEQYKVNEKSISNITVNHTVWASYTYNIPTNASPGTYRFGFKMDALNEVEESDENNFFSLKFVVDPPVQPKADLAIKEKSSYLNTKLSPADTLDFKTTIINKGESSSSQTLVNYYFDTSYHDWDTSKWNNKIGDDTIDPLSPNGESEETFTYTIPPNTPDGTYYFLLFIDAPNTVAESNGGNNKIYYKLTIKEDFPDIEYKSNSMTIPSSVSAGESITANFTIENKGTAPAEATTIKYYFDSYKEKREYEEQYKIDEKPIISLAPGHSKNLSYTFQVPENTAPGQYTFYFHIDPDDNIVEKTVNNVNKYKWFIDVQENTLEQPIIGSISPESVHSVIPKKLEISGQNFTGATEVRIYKPGGGYEKTYYVNQDEFTVVNDALIQIEEFTLDYTTAYYNVYVKNAEFTSDGFSKLFKVKSSDDPDLYVSYAKVFTNCVIDGEKDPTNYRSQDTMSIRFRIGNQGAISGSSTATVRLCDDQNCTTNSDTISSKNIGSIPTGDDEEPPLITYTNHPSWFNEGDLAYVVIEADSNNYVNEGSHEDKNSKADPNS